MERQKINLFFKEKKKCYSMHKILAKKWKPPWTVTESHSVLYTVSSAHLFKLTYRFHCTLYTEMNIC